MQSKLAILGASYLQLPLVLKAKELGTYTICFAWEDRAVCKDICDKFYPISIIENQLILEKCIEEKINGISSIAADIAVSTMSFVASKMNLSGNSIKSSTLSTNKYLMRAAFKQNGLLIPGFTKITDLKEINRAKDFKFPLIIKPVDRSGSLGITMVNHPDQLYDAIKNALGESFIQQAIVEEFIKGKEISIEAISWQGKHFILAYTDKITSGYPHFVELEHHQPSQLVNKANKKQIDNLVIKALDSLEIKNGASHSEFIITENNEIYVTEIGARMGGDFIGSDLVKLSTGYDYLKGVINIALGTFEKPVLTNNFSSGVYFYSIESKQIKRIIQTAQDDIVKSELRDLVNLELKQSSDRAGYFIYKSNNKLLLK